MTAHVLFPALDADNPATLSRAICTDLLRGELGFEGVLVSDDLEMGALRGGMSTGEAAVRAVDAGCDMLLVCSDEDLQDEAVRALASRADADARFRARCEEALARGLAMRRTRPPAPTYDAARGFGDESRAVGEALGPLGVTSTSGGAS